MDSNHDTQIQNLQCYRYTTRHFKLLEYNYLQQIFLDLPKAGSFSCR